MAHPKSAPILTLVQTNNVTIRLWHPTDAPSLQRAADNRKIWQNLRDRMPSPYTLADAEWWIAQCNDRENWARVLRFDADGREREAEGEAGPVPVPVEYAIVASSRSIDGDGDGDGNQDEIIGSIGLTMGTDVARRSAELGYWLAEPWWGRGVMSEAVAKMCTWVWATFPGLVRIYSEIYEVNEKSGRVLTKAGFAFEGRMKGAYFKEGRVGDVLMFGLVREGI